MTILHSADADAVAAYDATRQAYETTISITSGKRYAFGVVALVAEVGGTCIFKINGVQKEGVTTYADNLANLTSSYFEDGDCWTADQTGSVTFRVEISAGVWGLHGVIVREADTISAVVEDQGTGTHCYPLACVYGGERYQIHCEMYTGLKYLSKDGVNQGQIFATTSLRNDKYHYGCAIVPLTTGILALEVGHNGPQIRAKYLPGGAIGSASAERTIGGAASVLTYCQAVADSSNNVYIITRGSDDSGNGNVICYKLTNATSLVASAASYTVDVVTTSTSFSYPRHVSIYESGGVPVICVALAGGGAGVFTTAGAALFAPTMGTYGEWYTLNGTDATVNNALGTEVSPRFSGGVLTALPSANGLRLFGADITGLAVRYLPEAALFKVTQFPVDGGQNAKAAVFFPRMFGRGDQNTYGSCGLRFCIQYEGNTQLLSPYDFQGPQRWLQNPPDPNSHRVGACLRWLDDDPTTDEAIFWITDRGTRAATNEYGEATPLYYDWGGTKIRRFRVENPLTAPVFTLQETTDCGTLPGAFITAVAGETNKAIYQTGENELHETHRQSLRVLLSDPGGASVEEVSTISGDWTKYKTITVSHANIDEDLSYYPLVVKFASDADIGAAAHATGQNIRFTLTDGTLLNYKRRSFAVSTGQATGVFVVMVPTLSGSADTTIRIYYDNSAASDGQATAQQMWDSAHYLVHSNDQDPSGSAPQMTDETWRGFNGTSAGSMTSGDSVTGVLGNALDIDATDDVISYGTTETTADKISESYAYSIEVWVKNNANNLTRDAVIFSRGDLTTGAPCDTVWRDEVGVGGNNLYSFMPRFGSTTLRTEMADGSANTSGVWDYVAFTVRGDPASGVKGYKNGALSGTPTTNGDSDKKLASETSKALTIGKDGTTTTRLWDGQIDELRISLCARSAAWLKFTYANIANAGNELTFGAEQEVGGGGGSVAPVLLAIGVI